MDSLCSNLIFADKAEGTADSENRMQYINTISEISKHIYIENLKGKFPLIVTGVGISPEVPGMSKMMDKIIELCKGEDWIHSSTFDQILLEYENNESDQITSQSKLLTYIQNSYLERSRYVDEKDIVALGRVWDKYIMWLLNSCIKTDKGNIGILNAKPSKTHLAISQIYRIMDAISLTTNFDNLLKSAFEKESDSFYPLLDRESFEKYFTSVHDDHSYIEIQSRGDVFWFECTGKKNKTCLNIGRHCYVPGEYINANKAQVICNQCGSPARVYFAFPGTKEKDNEMTQVMSGLWKFIAHRISAVIVVGSSMDYDPVMLSFVRELLIRRKIRLMYISRSDTEKRATRTFFRDMIPNNYVWGRSKDASIILNDIIQEYQNIDKNPMPRAIDNVVELRDKYIIKSVNIVGQYDDLKWEETIAFFCDQNLNIVESFEIKKMQSYSQLGLKTYWLKGTEEKYNQHNRYKHSLGVMSIASVLYLAANEKKATIQEMRFLQLAALLHDIGHLPFSHLIEEIFEDFGWILGGEHKTFNHEQYGEKRILELEKNPEFATYIKQTGYEIKDLLQLIKGEFGIGYLDAIINSPIDADKIEYLFSDSIFTGTSHRDLFDSFMKQIVAGLGINQNLFLTVHGKSTKEFLELINMRGRMYNYIYLRKGLRYLEACCKLIIRTFIAHYCAKQDLINYINDEYINSMSNFSDAKIQYVLR